MVEGLDFGKDSLTYCNLCNKETGKATFTKQGFVCDDCLKGLA